MTMITPNRQVDYKLEAQILAEVTDLIQTVRIHLNSDGHTGDSSIRRCVEFVRRRMETVVGKRIARDIIKHRDPIVAMTFIIEKYFPESQNETNNTHSENSQG